MATEKANPDPQEVVDNAVVTPQRSASEDKEKGVMDVTCPLPDEPEKPGEFPLSWKITALVCGLMLSWGSSFSENTLGPLKKTLIRELDITNAQYGAISSATSLVNSILPILGGYGLDHYGVEWGSLVCSVAIFLGAVVSAASSNQDSFGLVMGGRIIMGFGSTVIETCTSKILAHWFQHRGLGLVYGLDLSIGKLIVLAAKASAVPMRDASSFWGRALWIPAIICFLNLLQNIFYVWWVRSRPEWTQMPTGQRKAKEEARSRAALGQGQVVMNNDTVGNVTKRTGGTVGSFNGLNADIITQTRGSTEQLTGYTSALQQVIPVVCAPMIGTFFDFFGYRMTFVSVTSVIWILVYCLIGFTKVNALGAMIIASVASTMNALPFLASIPLMVPSQLELGLVFGIWKAFNNSGSVIVDMIAGRLQDLTPGQTYERVVGFFVAVKGLEFCLGLFYGVLDRRYLAGILTMSEKKRLVVEKAGELGAPVGRKPAKPFTFVGTVLLCSMIIIS
ncbi:hypothetical protein NW759_013605 [Fusarium solani]|nr:hypothetical protein NW759_013605 [Fusarium solani]